MIPAIFSFVILGFFLWGRSLHKSNLALHIRVMTMVMLADVILVLALVVYRDALTKVHSDMKWSLFIHVPIAVSTLLLYGVISYFAYNTWKGKPWAHYIGAVDRVLLPARILTSLTALLVHFF